MSKTEEAGVAMKKREIGMDVPGVGPRRSIQEPKCIVSDRRHEQVFPERKHDTCFTSLLSRKFIDQRSVLRVLGGQADALRHFEICEVKAWRHRATNERVLIWMFHTGAEPVPCRHHPLELFACFRVLPQFDDAVIPGGVNAVDEQGCPGIKVPDLIGSQAVQSRKIFSCEQEIDRRGGTARPSEGGR